MYLKVAKRNVDGYNKLAFSEVADTSVELAAPVEKTPG
jgi:hypothetical protein